MIFIDGTFCDVTWFVFKTDSMVVGPQKWFSILMNFACLKADIFWLTFTEYFDIWCLDHIMKRKMNKLFHLA